MSSPQGRQAGSFGDVLGNNAKMLRLMHSLGFMVQPHPEESSLRRVVKVLHGN